MSKANELASKRAVQAEELSRLKSVQAEYGKRISDRLEGHQTIDEPGMSDADAKLHAEDMKKVAPITDSIKLIEQAMKGTEPATVQTDSHAHYLTAMRKYMSPFDKNATLTGEEQDLYLGATTRGEEQIFFRVRAAQTTTGTGGANASAAAAIDEILPPNVLVEQMKSFGGISALVSHFSTDHGLDIKVPNVDRTTQKGALIAEAEQAGNLDMPALGMTTIGSHAYTSLIAKISTRLLRDASFNVEQWTRDGLIYRLARIMADHMTTGTGDNRPKGALDEMKVAVTAASAVVVTFNELIDLRAAIDPAYLQPAGHGMGTPGVVGYGMSWGMFHTLWKLADTQNRPLFVTNYQGEAQMRLLNHPINIVFEMADAAAEAKTIIFGNMGFYLSRTTDTIGLLRFYDSAYASTQQVGFVAFAEADGQWIQPRTANKITCAQVLQMHA